MQPLDIYRVPRRPKLNIWYMCALKFRKYPQLFNMFCDLFTHGYITQQGVDKHATLLLQEKV